MSHSVTASVLDLVVSVTNWQMLSRTECQLTWPWTLTFRSPLSQFKGHSPNGHQNWCCDSLALIQLRLVSKDHGSTLGGLGQRETKAEQNIMDSVSHYRSWECGNSWLVREFHLGVSSRLTQNVCQPEVPESFIKSDSGKWMTEMFCCFKIYIRVKNPLLSL